MRSRIMFNPTSTNFSYNGLLYPDWGEFYEDLEETNFPKKPEPIGKSVIINMFLHLSYNGPAGSNRGNLGPVPAPVARGCHGPPKTLLLALKGTTDPE